MAPSTGNAGSVPWAEPKSVTNVRVPTVGPGPLQIPTPAATASAQRIPSRRTGALPRPAPSAADKDPPLRGAQRSDPATSRAASRSRQGSRQPRRAPPGRASRKPFAERRAQRRRAHECDATGEDEHAECGRADTRKRRTARAQRRERNRGHRACSERRRLGDGERRVAADHADRVVGGVSQSGSGAPPSPRPRAAAERATSLRPVDGNPAVDRRDEGHNPARTRNWHARPRPRREASTPRRRRSSAWRTRSGAEPGPDGGTPQRASGSLGYDAAAPPRVRLAVPIAPGWQTTAMIRPRRATRGRTRRCCTAPPQRSSTPPAPMYNRKSASSRVTRAGVSALAPAQPCRGGGGCPGGGGGGCSGSSFMAVVSLPGAGTSGSSSRRAAGFRTPVAATNPAAARTALAAAVGVAGRTVRAGSTVRIARPALVGHRLLLPVRLRGLPVLALPVLLLAGRLLP